MFYGLLLFVRENPLFWTVKFLIHAFLPFEYFEQSFEPGHCIVIEKHICIELSQQYKIIRFIVGKKTNRNIDLK